LGQRHAQVALQDRVALTVAAQVAGGTKRFVVPRVGALPAERAREVIGERFLDKPVFTVDVGSSFHRLCYLAEVGVRVQAMRLCECHKRSGRGTRLPLLNAANLAFGQTGDPRLRYSRLFSELTDSGAVPLVEFSAPLLNLTELLWINCLQELVPSQMDVEVGPVEERAVGVYLKVPLHSTRLVPKRRKRLHWHVQNPVLRPPDKQRVPDRVCVNDTAALFVSGKSEADPTQQMRHVGILEILNLHDVKAFLRSKLGSPGPLHDLIGVRARLGEKQVERRGEQVFDHFVGRDEMIFVGMRKHDDVGGPPHSLLHRCMEVPVARRCVAELVQLPQARQRPIVLGGMMVGMGEPR
jgi:hypothetical protein